MKKRMTRRRSALCWTALAAALVFLWGVAAGYNFTPGQARREHWKRLGLKEMETVIELGRDRHPYTAVLGGPDYERHILCANEERMELIGERLEVFGKGWFAHSADRVELAPPRAAAFPEVTVWAGEYYDWTGSGYVYFRAEGMTGAVKGFSPVMKLKSDDGPPRDWLRPGVDFTAAGQIPGADGTLARAGLTGDGRGHFYGVIPYYPKDVTWFCDAYGLYEWYIRIELTDGRVLYAPCFREGERGADI